jgi:hypothetical protein
MAVILFSSSFAIAQETERAPFSGKSKQDYYNLKETLKKGSDKLPPISKAIEKNDWGQCRDYCYQQRNQCFNSGGDAYTCDAWYDSCVAGCDAIY